MVLLRELSSGRKMLRKEFCGIWMEDGKGNVFRVAKQLLNKQRCCGSKFVPWAPLLAGRMFHKDAVIK